MENEIIFEQNTTVNRNLSTLDFYETGKEIQVFFSSVAGVCILEFLLVIFLFPSEPQFFANRSSYEKTRKPEDTAGPLSGFFSILKRLLIHKSYMLLLVNYGLIIGVYYAVSTLLSQILDHEAATVGLMGALMVITGLFGSVLGGILLDKTKAFKNISLVFYVFTLICFAVFSGVHILGHEVADFILIGALGFFMTGYLPIGLVEK